MDIKNKIFEKLKSEIYELNEEAATIACNSLNAAETETLYAVVMRGPLFAGDIPSKSALENLIDIEFVIPVTVRNEEGHYAATYLGHRVIKYGCYKDGEAPDTNRK